MQNSTLPPYTVACTGPRDLAAPWIGFITQLVCDLAQQHHFAVGDAQGADQYVRAAAPDAHVFRAARRSRQALVGRSIALIRAAKATEHSALIAFPACTCPDPIAPADRWISGGSGTWSTIALAIGLQLPTYLFLCGLCPSLLPHWNDGYWCPVTLGHFRRSWTWRKGSLFSGSCR